jgi:hypothetical protein
VWGAAALAAALPAVVPYTKVIAGPAVSDTLGLVPWWSLEDSVMGHGYVRAAIVGASIAAAGAFALLPRRFGLLLPAVVLTYFALEHWPIESGPHSVRDTARRSALTGLGVSPRDWIDRVVGRGGHVTAIRTPRSSPFTIWESEFFNRSVGRVFRVGGAIRGALGGLPESQASLDARTGAVLDAQERPIRASYVLIDARVALNAPAVAVNPLAAMALYRVDAPVRLRLR